MHSTARTPTHWGHDGDAGSAKDAAMVAIRENAEDFWLMPDRWMRARRTKAPTGLRLRASAPEMDRKCPPPQQGMKVIANRNATRQVGMMVTQR